MKKLKLVIYKDQKGQFRWRAVRSGRIVAESGEGYLRKRSLNRTLDNLVYACNYMNYTKLDTTL